MCPAPCQGKLTILDVSGNQIAHIENMQGLISLEEFWVCLCLIIGYPMRVKLTSLLLPVLAVQRQSADRVEGD